MNNKTRKDLQKSADELVAALGVYKSALETFFEVDDHKGCYQMKRQIIENEYRKVDKNVTKIIMSADAPAECAILGFHAAVVEHMLFNVEHVARVVVGSTVKALIDSVNVDVIKLQSDEECKLFPEEGNSDTTRSN